MAESFLKSIFRVNCTFRSLWSRTFTWARSKGMVTFWSLIFFNLQCSKLKYRLKHVKKLVWKCQKLLHLWLQTISLRTIERINYWTSVQPSKYFHFLFWQELTLIGNELRTRIENERKEIERLSVSVYIQTLTTSRF